jgi:hypothetical protein
MDEIEVRMTGDQEAQDGVVEFWHGGEQVAFTHYDPHDGHLLIRIDPRSDGEPLRLDVRALREALAEAERLLSGS